ncbi:galactinol--raffinose galactosyltransferase [Sarracenia purpurea var. burkii]
MPRGMVGLADETAYKRQSYIALFIAIELITFLPVQKQWEIAKFAPIGLENMFNSWGTIQFLDYGCSVMIKVKGVEMFLAYSSNRPKEVFLNHEKMEFDLL